MAARGRKRQHDPSIPGHIDQGAFFCRLLSPAGAS